MPETTLNDSNFEKEVLESKLPVLVDFWATWCMPCFIIAPIVQESGQDFEGKLKIGKLNIDENPIVSSTYNIEAIPALILFKNGQIIRKLIGVRPKEMLAEAIDSIINGETRK